MVRLLAVLVLAAASASSVLAGTSYYQNTAPINLVSESSRITGSYGNNYDAGTRINAANNSVSLRVGFDTSISKMWVDQITFNIAIAPKILTSNLVDVYGALKEITTTINFNPISISYSELGNDRNGPIYRDITPGSGGAYSLNWRTVSSYNGKLNSDPYITGSYSVSGPTETRTGSFAINLNCVNLTLPDFINLSKPNDEVIFASVLTQIQGESALRISPFLPSSSPGTDPIFYSVVDDVNVATGLYLDTFALSGTQFKLEAIPEPSSLSLLLAGGLIALARRRKI